MVGIGLHRTRHEYSAVSRWYTISNLPSASPLDVNGVQTDTKENQAERAADDEGLGSTVPLEAPRTRLWFPGIRARPKAAQDVPVTNGAWSVESVTRSPSEPRARIHPRNPLGVRAPFWFADDFLRI